jgi:NAD(P)-dependent dehydrogenase (short-subunit alcohol dehydrogenase family)
MRETAGRNAPQVGAAKQFSIDNSVDLRTIELDVASQQSADEAIHTIVQRDGRLDVVIHNAGQMVFGAAEAFTPEQLAQLYGCFGCEVGREIRRCASAGALADSRGRFESIPHL